jgi:hypothetical protein
MRYRFKHLGQAVLAQAVTDFFLGRPGKTISGRSYPGGWLARRTTTRELSRRIREDAEAFFFDDERREVREMWFHAADVDVKPGMLREWLDERIAARHPRAYFDLSWDGPT